jgi:hypothetical protein
MDYKDTSAYPRLQAGVKRHYYYCALHCHGRYGVGETPSPNHKGGEPAVVRTAMTRTPMGPHWPGHSPTRETNESSPGVSPVPSECGLEPKGVPMVGFHVVYAVEEVN